MRTNVVKMVSMVCQPCCAIGGHSAETCGLRMMIEVINYRERLHQQVLCPDCDIYLVVGGSLRLDTYPNPT